MPKSRLILLLMPVVLISAQSAEAAQSCLTVAEAQQLVQVALPDVITSVGDKCAAALPKSSFLVANKDGAAARYRKEAEIAWPGAKAAAIKLAGESKFFALLPDSAARSIVTGMVTLGVSEKVKAEQCAAFDRMFGAVAPLPSANIATFIVAVVELQPPPAVKAGQKPLLALCPAMPAPRPGNTTTK
jgi:hypothetical protein